MCSSHVRRAKRRPRFRHREFGSMATIGRKRAVAQIGVLKLSGLMAWLLWSVAHIYFLIGFRNRLPVAANWCWNYLTFQRGTRLITGITGSRIEDVMPVVPAAPKSLEIGDDSRHYRVVWRFRSPHYSCSESEMRTSEPKPH